MNASKQISVRFNGEQIAKLEEFCAIYKTDMARTVRLIFDDWVSRKEHSENRLLEIMADQSSERKALNSQNKLILQALKLVFSAQISGKEMDYWWQESVIANRKEAQEIFDQTLNEMEKVSSDV